MGIGRRVLPLELVSTSSLRNTAPTRSVVSRRVRVPALMVLGMGSAGLACAHPGLSPAETPPRESRCFTAESSLVFPLGYAGTLKGASSWRVWLILTHTVSYDSSRDTLYHAATFDVIGNAQDGSWWAVGDSIRIQVNDELTFNDLTVHEDANGLRGRGTGTTDVLKQTPSGVFEPEKATWIARLSAIRCSAMPPRPPVHGFSARIHVEPPSVGRTDTLGDSDLTVAGLRLGMSRSDVDSVRKPPLGVIVRRAPSGLRVEYDSTGHVNRIVLTSPRVATTRGLRVGDSVARVHELYGQRWLSFTTKDSTTTMGLPRETEWVGITVIVRGGIVREIDVGPVTSLD